MYSDIDRVWTPRGRYTWKYRYSRDGLFINEIEQIKDKLIDMQLFNQDINRLNQIKEVHDKMIKNSQF